MIIQNIAQARKLIKDACVGNIVIIDTENKEDSPEGFTVAYRHEEKEYSFYFPVGHEDYILNIPLDQAKKYLKEICDNAEKVVFHNAQYDLNILEKFYQIEIPLHRIECTLLMHWCIDSERYHGLKDIMKNEFGIADTVKYKAAKQSLEDFFQYAVNDGYYTLRLYEKLSRQINNLPRVKKAYRTFEIPFINVLRDMNQRRNFIRVDYHLMRYYVGIMDIEKEFVTDYLKEKLGNINFNSNKQLGFALQQQGYKVKRKESTGNYMLDAGKLQELYNRQGGAVLGQLLYHRSVEKMINTYVWKIYTLLRKAEDGCYYLRGYSFLHWGTATGRMSSNNPNMQNMPRDPFLLVNFFLDHLKNKLKVNLKVKLTDDVAKLIKEQYPHLIPEMEKYQVDLRKIFIAREGYSFIDADFSQIELRVAAHLSGDPKMIEFYSHENADFHKATADGINAILKKNMITRQHGKTINFFFQYGGYYKTLAKDLRITESQALQIDKAYSSLFIRRTKWIAEVHQSGRKEKFVYTMLGRRRNMHTKGINESPEGYDTGEERRRAFMDRNSAENAAISTVVQGSAADILKVAMLNIHEQFDDNDFRIVLQVHDEVLIEVKTEYAEEMLKKVRYTLENAVKLKVPVIADAHIGKSWREAH